MRHCLLLFICTISCLQAAIAQRLFTFDPETDFLARRNSTDSIQLLAPIRAIAVAIQDANPQVTDIDQVEIRQIGKSRYLVATGKDTYRPGNRLTLAILLAETKPGYFQADAVVISCSSSGECRECALPPNCSCVRGEGGCAQNNAWYNAMRKVTLTLYD